MEPELLLDRSLEAESFRKKFLNVCFLGTVSALKEHGGVGAELINDLPTRATGRTGHAAVVRQGNSLDLDGGTEFGNGGEDRRTLGAVGHAVRRILDVAAREYLSIRQQDRCTDPKLGIGSMCILHDSRGRPL